MRTERAIVIGHRFHWLARVGVLAFGRRNVERAGQVIYDRVDQILNTDILESRAANDRHEFVRNRLATNARLQQLGRDFALFEHCLGHFVVEVRNLLD